MANHNGTMRKAGQALLQQGLFAAGYRLIEQEPGFFRSDEFYKLPKDKRLMRGMAVAGKTVLLALEGGFGDEVAWGRYAQHLRAAGARVLVGTLPASLGTLSTLRDAHEVKRLELIRPDEYDYYLLGMSAADYFDIKDPSAGVTFPYLATAPAHTERVRPLVRQMAGGLPKIGIHWQGNKEFEHLEQKSYPPELLRPFLKLGTLFSLQRDAGTNAMPEDMRVVDTQQGPADWEHTLAVIGEMDYLITGCTSIAHYAGALGKQVLLIINHAPSYYWADAADTTRWYPSVRVFRQPRPGDWEGALKNAHVYLQSRIATRAPAAQDEPKKILISAVGGLGDHATAEPVIRYLISQYPGADIRIAAYWPRMFAHLGVPLSRHGELPEDGYKNVWTLPGPNSPLLRAANFLLCHMADYHALAMLNRQIPLAAKEIRLGITEEDRAQLRAKLGGADPRRLVALHAGKSWKSKSFPLPWWQAVADALAARGCTVALIGKSASDVQGDATGLVPIQTPPGGIDLRDRLPLGELFALLEQAPVLLTNDSAPVQIAGAFDQWIVMLATIKPPELVFPIRRGSTGYKTKALYKTLLADEIAFDPLFSPMMHVDFAVDDWSRYLPEPEEVAKAVAELYNKPYDQGGAADRT